MSFSYRIHLGKVIVIKCSFINSREMQYFISVKFYLSRSPEKKSSFLVLIDFLIPFVIHGFDSCLILIHAGSCLLLSLFNLLKVENSLSTSSPVSRDSQLSCERSCKNLFSENFE